jgi:hypothetical protein
MKVHKQLSSGPGQFESRLQVAAILKTNQVFVSCLHGWPQHVDDVGAYASNEICVQAKSVESAS